MVKIEVDTSPLRPTYTYTVQKLTLPGYSVRLMSLDPPATLATLLYLDTGLVSKSLGMFKSFDEARTRAVRTLDYVDATLYALSHSRDTKGGEWSPFDVVEVAYRDGYSKRANFGYSERDLDMLVSTCIVKIKEQVPQMTDIEFDFVYKFWMAGYHHTIPFSFPQWE